jgi:cyclopropane fatty-acyl-phospholipid synthase-like methyltransferase
MQKPFSQACENNRGPIFTVLETCFADCSRVLEIGSGSGQHAVYFAERLPHVIWQTSDLAVNHPGINAWLADYAGNNLHAPVELDVSLTEWGICCNYDADAVFSANTAHIMSWPVAQQMIAGVGALLPADGVFALYGPFNYNGQFTSPSNVQFDLWLKQQRPHQGIRHFEEVVACAEAAGMTLQQDNDMPANNRLLVFKKTS